jgi:hypothetical protein
LVFAFSLEQLCINYANGEFVPRVMCFCNWILMYDLPVLTAHDFLL